MGANTISFYQKFMGAKFFILLNNCLLLHKLLTYQNSYGRKYILFSKHSNCIKLKPIFKTGETVSENVIKSFYGGE